MPPKKERKLEHGEACYAKTDCYIQGSFEKGERVTTIKVGDPVPEALVEVRKLEAETVKVSVNNPLAILIDKVDLSVEQLAEFHVYLGELAEMNGTSLVGVMEQGLAQAEDMADSFKAWSKDYKPEAPKPDESEQAPEPKETGKAKATDAAKQAKAD